MLLAVDSGILIYNNNILTLKNMFRSMPSLYLHKYPRRVYFFLRTLHAFHSISQHLNLNEF